MAMRSKQSEMFSGSCRTVFLSRFELSTISLVSSVGKAKGVSLGNLSCSFGGKCPVRWLFKILD